MISQPDGVRAQASSQEIATAVTLPEQHCSFTHAYAIAAGPNRLAKPRTDTMRQSTNNIDTFSRTTTNNTSATNAHGLAGEVVRVTLEQDKFSQTFLKKR